MNVFKYKDSVADIGAAIEEFDKIIVTGHILPDGDCLGATHALGYYLAATYPHKRIYIYGAPDDSKISRLFENTFSGYVSPKNALVIICDTRPVDDRVAYKEWKDAEKVIVIDHHPASGEKNVADITLRDEDASSCCEIIANLLLNSLLQEGRYFLTFSDTMVQKAVRALLIGIITDTNGFSTSSTTPETFAIVSKLATYVDYNEIYESIYKEDLSVVKAKFEALNRLTRYEPGEKDSYQKVAALLISREFLEAFQIDEVTAGNFITELQNIEQAPIALIAIEYPDGSLRCRLRSHGIPISGVARKYGGGGHLVASGCTLKSLDEYRSLVDDLKKLL